MLVSHDFSSSYLDCGSLQNRFNGIEVIVRHRPVRRGNASILGVFLGAMEWLRQQRFSIRLVDLSFRSRLSTTAHFSNLVAFLETTQYDGFIDYWDVLSSQNYSQKQEASKRFFSQYLALPMWTQGAIRKLSWLEHFTVLRTNWFFGLLGVESRTTPFTEKFRCYRGWYWFTLSKFCLDYLTSYLDAHPQLLGYYCRTIAPEESLIQTILVNSKRFKLHNGSLRYMEFPSELRGYARELTFSDYPQLVDSGCHFGRKFDLSGARALIDLLDTRVLGDKQVKSENNNSQSRLFL